MHILTEHNLPLDTDQIGDETDVYYCMLDFSKPKSPDYSFVLVEFIHTYTASAAVLDIGGFRVTIPADWSLMVSEDGRAEVISIEEIISRDLKAFCLNPINGFVPSFLPIRLVSLIRITNFTCPDIPKTSMIAVPIGYHSGRKDADGRAPLCMFACESKAKVPEHMDASILW